MTATNIRPQRNASAVAGIDTSQSPRDPRRVWVNLLPQRQAFRSPAAKILAEWSDAVQTEDGWEAWCAAHPTDRDVLPKAGRA